MAAVMLCVQQVRRASPHVAHSLRSLLLCLPLSLLRSSQRFFTHPPLALLAVANAPTDGTTTTIPVNGDITWGKEVRVKNLQSIELVAGGTKPKRRKLAIKGVGYVGTKYNKRYVYQRHFVVDPGGTLSIVGLTLQGGYQSKGVREKKCTSVYRVGKVFI